MNSNQRKLIESFIRNEVRKCLKEERKTTKLLTESEFIYRYLREFSKELFEKWTTMDFDQYGSEEDIMEDCNKLLEKFDFPYSIIRVVIKPKYDFNEYFFKLQKK